MACHLLPAQLFCGNSPRVSFAWHHPFAHGLYVKPLHTWAAVEQVRERMGVVWAVEWCKGMQTKSIPVQTPLLDNEGRVGAGDVMGYIAEWSSVIIQILQGVIHKLNKNNFCSRRVPRRYFPQFATRLATSAGDTGKKIETKTFAGGAQTLFSTAWQKALTNTP